MFLVDVRGERKEEEEFEKKEVSLFCLKGRKRVGDASFFRWGGREGKIS